MTVPESKALRIFKWRGSLHLSTLNSGPTQENVIKSAPIFSLWIILSYLLKRIYSSSYLSEVVNTSMQVS